MRILVLEDHDDVRLWLKLSLECEGFAVADYATAESAAAGLDGPGPDVAILDVRLPGRSGDAFGRDLVRRHPGTRVIFATAEADLAALTAAVPDCLVLRKPFDFDALLPLLTAARDRTFCKDDLEGVAP